MHYLGLRHKRERVERQARREKLTLYQVFLDKLTLAAGIIGPFTVLPQTYSIFSTRSAANVSFTTWLSIFVVTLPWVFYGLAHRDKTIIISFIMWEIANFSVVLGILLYGSV